MSILKRFDIYVMKHRIITILLSLVAVTECFSASLADKIGVDSLMFSRDGATMSVDFDMLLQNLDVPANRAVLIVPIFRAGSDSVSLKPVGVYGRTRYFQYRRNSADGTLIAGTDEIVYRASSRPEEVDYHADFPYEEWMEGATLELRSCEYGCCRSLLATDVTRIPMEYRTPVPPVFVPDFLYVTPKAEGVKTRSLSGRAFIDFPVNRTEIHPDYRGNKRELAMIRATIDSVRNDADITVTSLSVKGYASPEGSWKNNERLAKGRTEALKDYVQELYHFPQGFIDTAYQPEDWDGLREYVESSDMVHKDEILAVIDSSLEPDTKDARLRRGFPKEYQFLLKDVYPALRHSDYTISYNIRTFSDTADIRRIMHTAPQKLSQDEFYLLASSYQQGSQEFNEVFEMAVRMYPSDATANLNAANTAMVRGDLAAASRYLDKTGGMPEAVYARGVLAAIGKDWAAAEKYFIQAEKIGIGKAVTALESIKPFLADRDK